MTQIDTESCSFCTTLNHRTDILLFSLTLPELCVLGKNNVSRSLPFCLFPPRIQRWHISKLFEMIPSSWSLEIMKLFKQYQWIQTNCLKKHWLQHQSGANELTRKQIGPVSTHHTCWLGRLKKKKRKKSRLRQLGRCLIVLTYQRSPSRPLFIFNCNFVRDLEQLGSGRGSEEHALP